MNKVFLIVTTLLSISFAANAQTAYNDTVENRVVPEYENVVCPNVSLKMWNRVAVTGSGKDIRAFSPWKSIQYTSSEYSKVANLYKKTFGDKVNIWLMPIPTAAAFYSPKNNAFTSEQYSTINYMFGYADKDVHCVDIHTILGQHANENIYARTDHHWLPLGAYYAAKRFAALAGVPFVSIEDSTRYQHRVIHRYCGTMYHYTKNINVKNNPEDFDFWLPIAAKYSTSIVQFKYAGVHQVTGEFIPKDQNYFKEYPDGSAAAYCTFIGGDARLVHVHTNVGNGRKVLFIKDSFGNAIPGYLFYSFEDLHVIDCRYFNRNLTEYVEKHGITDIVLCNNLQFVGQPKIQDALKRYLTQNPTR